MRIVGLLLTVILFPAIALATPLVNINTATAVQLESLPGIGPTKATAIIDYRTAHGPFARIEDIQNVKGIGAVTFANIKGSITVGTVSSEQPLINTVSSKQVQTVEKITSTKTAVQTNEEAVIAPTTTAEPVAVGAVAVAPAQNLFHSLWTLGLVGVVILASVAFIFL